MAKAHLTNIGTTPSGGAIYEIRVFDDGQEHGDPWRWGAIGMQDDVDPLAVEIRLAIVAPTTAQRRAIDVAFKQLGYVRWIRR